MRSRESKAFFILMLKTSLSRPLSDLRFFMGKHLLQIVAHLSTMSNHSPHLTKDEKRRRTIKPDIQKSP